MLGWVKPATAAMEDIELPERFSSVRLVNPAKAEISDIKLSKIHNPLSLVKPATDEISDIELSQRDNDVRLVKPESAEISDIELPPRFNPLSLVKPARGDRSDIELLLIGRPSSAPSSSLVRLVAPSSPVKSLILAFCALRRVKAAISAGAIGVPGVLPSASSMAARRLGVGDVCRNVAESDRLGDSFDTCANRVRAFNGIQCKPTLCPTIFIGCSACGAECPATGR